MISVFAERFVFISFDMGKGDLSMWISVYQSMDGTHGTQKCPQII